MSTFRVLYNKCYGGFNLSNEAVAAYNALAKADVESGYAFESIESRTLPILLSIFDSLGSAQFSGPCAKIGAVEIEEKYRDYVSVSEYDGLESVHIDRHTYSIHSILKSEQSDADKVTELKKLFGLQN